MTQDAEQLAAMIYATRDAKCLGARRRVMGGRHSTVTSRTNMPDLVYRLRKWRVLWTETRARAACQELADEGVLVRLEGGWVVADYDLLEDVAKLCHDPWVSTEPAEVTP